MLELQRLQPCFLDEIDAVREILQVCREPNLVPELLRHRVREFCAHVCHAHLPPRVDEALGKRETDQAATYKQCCLHVFSLGLLARGHTVCCMATATQKVYKN